MRGAEKVSKTPRNLIWWEIRLHPETHAGICGSEGITTLSRRPYEEGGFE